jgi:ABC-type transport system involved in cytochrome bd biosynthesis fused ATPase/permease subunit
MIYLVRRLSQALFEVLRDLGVVFHHQNLHEDIMRVLRSVLQRPAERRQRRF